MGLVEINPGLIIWTMLTFVALMLILRFFAWKPLLGMLDERERTISDSLDLARKTKEDAERLVIEHREMLTKARQEMAAIIEKAQRDAEQRRSDILARAQRDAEEKGRQFAEDLERQKRAAIRELKEESVDLVLAAASRLLSSTLDDEKHRALAKGYLEDIKKLPPPS